MGWEQHLLPRLVALADGETVTHAENLAVGLDAPGKEMTHNHVGMAVVGEALRAWRAYRNPVDMVAREIWLRAARRLKAYLGAELTNGLWNGEPLCPTPHDAFYVAIAMFARLVAVESQDPELLRLTVDYCRALGRLCATLSDPTGEVLTAGVRVPLAKGGKEQKRPVHSALTEWWRYLNGRPNRVAKLSAEPMYAGLRLLREKWNEVGDVLALDDVFCFTSPQAPTSVPMSRPVVIHRWPGGHQVELPRRGNEMGLTKGSASPNGTCDWLRAEYGKGKKGSSAVTFGMLWSTPPPPVPKGAQRIEWGTP
jgi:hypothetical protein